MQSLKLLVVSNLTDEIRKKINLEQEGLVSQVQTVEREMGILQQKLSNLNIKHLKNQGKLEMLTELEVTEDGNSKAE